MTTAVIVGDVVSDVAVDAGGGRKIREEVLIVGSSGSRAAASGGWIAGTHLVAASRMTSVAIVKRTAMIGAARKRRTRSAGVVAALAIGTSASVFVPFGILGLVAATCLFGLLLSAANGNVRPLLLASADRRARRARRRGRKRALARSAFGGVTLAELTKLVGEIERLAPDQDRGLDLELLLDRHVALTIAHEQAVLATGMADRTQLERIRDGCRSDASVDSRRRDLCERRIRCLDECEAIAEATATELTIVADTIRLIAQRTACPDAPARCDAIDRQLAELDEADAARRELALLCSETARSVTPTQPGARSLDRGVAVSSHTPPPELASRPPTGSSLFTTPEPPRAATERASTMSLAGQGEAGVPRQLRRRCAI